MYLSQRLAESYHYKQPIDKQENNYFLLYFVSRSVLNNAGSNGKEGADVFKMSCTTCSLKSNCGCLLHDGKTFIID